MTTTMASTTNANATAKKMTKKDYFNQLRILAMDNEELVNFIDHELELLEKKSVSKKPTQRQQENEVLKTFIISYLTEVDTAVTIKTIQENIPELSPEKGVTNQRITHLLSALIKDNKVERSYVKKTPYFCIVQ